MKHSETPWFAQFKDIGNGSKQWRLDAADGYPICASDVGPHAFNDANAHFIVAAANAHQALVEALEAVMLWIGDQADSDPPFRQARAALALARATHDSDEIMMLSND